MSKFRSKEGPLEMLKTEGMKKKRWKCYYFRVSAQTSLHCFRLDNVSEPKETVMLSCVTKLDSAPMADADFPFAVYFKGKGLKGSPWILKAKNDADRRAWMEVIQPGSSSQLLDFSSADRHITATRSLPYSSRSQTVHERSSTMAHGGADRSQLRKSASADEYVEMAPAPCYPQQKMQQGHMTSPHGVQQGHMTSPHGAQQGHMTSPHAAPQGHMTSPHGVQQGHMTSPHGVQQGHMTSPHGAQQGHMTSPHGVQQGHMTSPHGTQQGHMTSPHAQSVYQNQSSASSLQLQSMYGNRAQQGHMTSQNAAQQGHMTPPNRTQQGHMTPPSARAENQTSWYQTPMKSEPQANYQNSAQAQGMYHNAAQQGHMTPQHAVQQGHMTPQHATQQGHMTSPHGQSLYQNQAQGSASSPQLQSTYGNAAQQGHMTSPNLASQGHMISPGQGSIQPQNSMYQNQGHMTSPQSSLQPQAIHQGHMTSPQGHMTSPQSSLQPQAMHQGHMTSPQSSLQPMQGHMTSPQGHMTSPQSSLQSMHQGSPQQVQSSDNDNPLAGMMEKMAQFSPEQLKLMTQMFQGMQTSGPAQQQQQQQQQQQADQSVANGRGGGGGGGGGDDLVFDEDDSVFEGTLAAEKALEITTDQHAYELLLDDDTTKRSDYRYVPRPAWAKAVNEDKINPLSELAVSSEGQELTELLAIPKSSLHNLVQIGEGQFGRVFRAVLRRGPEVVEVAVKTTKPAASSDKEKEGFLKEMRIMSLMMHPNIVKLYGLVQDEEAGPSIVIEYLLHGDLKSFLEKHSRPVPQLVKYMLDVAMGMHYLSERGLIHRDLAARNVLVGERELCKVADFGLLRELPKDDSIYEMKTEVPCPIRWMSPESMKQRTFSVASDVWSYGILMWEMFHPHRNPYSELEGNIEVAANVLQGYRLEVPGACPRVVAKIMRSCWHHDPNKRPSFLLIYRTLLSAQ